MASRKVARPTFRVVYKSSNQPTSSSKKRSAIAANLMNSPSPKKIAHSTTLLPSQNIDAERQVVDMLDFDTFFQEQIEANAQSSDVYSDRADDGNVIIETKQDVDELYNTEGQIEASGEITEIYDTHDDNVDIKPIKIGDYSEDVVAVASILSEPSTSQVEKKILSDREIVEQLPEPIKTIELVCQICGNLSPTKFILQRHFLKHLEDSAIRHNIEVSTCCKYCDFVTDDPDEMNAHMLTHVLRNWSTCQICNQKLRDCKERWIHLTKHTTANRYPCAKCNKMFDNVLDVANHEVLHQRLTDRVMVCPYCGLGSVDIQLYKWHVFTHRHSPFRCAECGMVCSEASEFRRHADDEHSTVHVRCDQCTRHIPYEEYEQHLLTHRRIGKIRCDICNAGFATEEQLRLHKRRQHSIKMQSRSKYRKIPSMRCHMCNIATVFKSHYQLEVHLATHLGYQPYKCYYCDVLFQTSVKRWLHMDEAHGHLTCEHCDAKFVTQHRLNLHNRNVHGNEDETSVKEGA